MIALIGIMAMGAIVVINPLTQIQKANDAKREGSLSQIQKALEVYYNDYGYFPTAASNKISGINWGSSWAPYMSTLPADPTASRNYIYCSTGQSYYLYASLERGGPLTTNNCGVSTLCGSGVPTCNYGISSPNVSP